MRSVVSVGRLYFLCLSVALGLGSVQATDYYVSTQGSDSNSGTSTQPLRTIARAYSLATAGSTITVMSGVYTEYTSGWGLHLGKSGSASSPIVLKSQVRGGAVIDGRYASDRNQAVYMDGSYNVLDGFDVRGGPKGGIAVYGSGVRVLNCNIHDNGNSPNTSYSGSGIYSDSRTSGGYYAANSIHDNGQPGSNLDHGMYLCGDNESVINNLLVRNAACGLQIAGYSTVSNMKVYNNVVAWNGTSGIILWMSLSGVDIKNNIICHSGTYGVNSYDAHGSGVVVDHNLFHGNVLGNYTFTRGGSDYSATLNTAIAADPLFVNGTSSGFDGHLSGSSPALKAGLNLYAVFTTDKDGAARVSSGAWDLGAYSYSTANTAPTISSMANQTTTAGRAVGPLAFTVGDAQTAASSLVVSASSSNPTLVPNANIALGGSGTSRTVTVTPASGQTGTATINLQVSDGLQIAGTPFELTVSTSIGAGVTPPALSSTFREGIMQIRWPTNCGNYVLQSSTVTSLMMSGWVEVTNTPVLDGDHYMVRYPASEVGMLFRLRSR